MLTELSITHYALIEQVNIDFRAGMTVLSGETGAGKSILVGALALILGGRADADSVRDGCQQADITARFDVAKLTKVSQWLEDKQLDADGECIIRRVISKQGRSRSWINGRPVPIRELKNIGSQLVSIHGQHASQTLLHKNNQRQLLDAHGQHQNQLEQVKQAHQALQKTRQDIEQIEQRNANGDMRIDLLRYQVDELNELELTDEQYHEIEAEHLKQANAEKRIQMGHKAHEFLTQEQGAGALDQLGSAEAILSGLVELDDDFSDVLSLIFEAQIQAQEAADTLRNQIDNIQIDPQAFTALETQLAQIQDLARKHQVSADELPALTQRLNEELDSLEHAGEHLQSLKAQYQQQLEAYQKHARKLSQTRQKTAKKMAADISAIIQTLGMPQAQFSIQVVPDFDAAPAPAGLDSVSFLISANAGQSQRPLERVASGGELSRISLAIEVIAADHNHIPTRIFDEVDAGIGGGVAEIVGRQLQVLGQSGQSLCVTHLPQVAALADQQLRVKKQTKNGQTRTRILQLNQQERINEIARMLGGVNITQRTRAHAAEMIGGK